MYPSSPGDPLLKNRKKPLFYGDASIPLAKQVSELSEKHGEFTYAAFRKTLK